MLVVGVPSVVVRDRVPVHIELTVVIEVHIGNEELYGEPSTSLPALPASLKTAKETKLYIIRGLKAYQRTAPTFMFFVLKKNPLSSKP